MPLAFKDQCVAEKTPAYFRSRPAELPDIIDRDLPAVKLWVILCNPVQRAFSDYVMRVSNTTTDRHVGDGMNMSFLNFSKGEKRTRSVELNLRNTSTLSCRPCRDCSETGVQTRNCCGTTKPCFKNWKKTFVDTLSRMVFTRIISRDG